PLGAPEPSQWREDPWVIAAKTFAPCYIGGWSACEHWGLTEQVFRDVVIVTGRPVRRQRVEIQGNPFRLKALPSTKQFGTRQVWRGRVRVLVSDPARTVVDILDDPAIGGGIRHAASVIKAYLESEHRDDALLLEHARRRGNRAVFKRLGHIVEVLGIPAQGIQDACKASKSLGLALLDPRVPAKGRIVKRWSLRVNVELPRGGTSA
ncbi:MAG: hypothetical protein HY721_13365, partial [Planctomycetes bacterium]|nr:hypothetical protein [Planctomycetota bacterium]